MNFINDRELALRFKNNAVPSKERFLYLLIFVALTNLSLTSFGSTSLHPTQPNQWDMYMDIIGVTLCILGTIICYRTNKSGDNKEFIERYISIGFPVAIQAFFVALVGAIIANILFILLGYGEPPEESSLLGVITAIASAVYYYARLNSSIKRAAH